MPRNKTAPFQLSEPADDMEREFLASIAVGPDAGGNYRSLTIPNIPTYEQAQHVIRRLHRPRKRKRFLKNGKMQFGLKAEIIKTNDTYSVKYNATTREAALRYVMERYGDDPAKWAYSTNPEHENYGA